MTALIVTIGEGIFQVQEMIAPVHCVIAEARRDDDRIVEWPICQQCYEQVELRESQLGHPVTCPHCKTVLEAVYDERGGGEEHWYLDRPV